MENVQSPHPRICVISTVLSVANMLDPMLRSRHPDADVFHIVDETILAAVARGDREAEVAARVEAQVLLAERSGADLILFSCSTTSTAVTALRDRVSIPVVKIDDAMAARAVEIGNRVGVICTAAIAVPPSQALLLDHAARERREIVLNISVEAEAAAARRRGDQAAHDAIISDRAVAMVPDVDVIVLAQASMAHLAPKLSRRLRVPVLGSPDLCIEAVSGILNDMQARRA